MTSKKSTAQESDECYYHNKNNKSPKSRFETDFELDFPDSKGNISKIMKILTKIVL